jgi:hypothetical protein
LPRGALSAEPRHTSMAVPCPCRGLVSVFNFLSSLSMRPSPQADRSCHPSFVASVSRVRDFRTRETSRARVEGWERAQGTQRQQQWGREGGGGASPALLCADLSPSAAAGTGPPWCLSRCWRGGVAARRCSTSRSPLPAGSPLAPNTAPRAQAGLRGWSGAETSVVMHTSRRNFGKTIRPPVSLDPPTGWQGPMPACWLQVVR